MCCSSSITGSSSIGTRPEGRLTRSVSPGSARPKQKTGRPLLQGVPIVPYEADFVYHYFPIILVGIYFSFGTPIQKRLQIPGQLPRPLQPRETDDSLPADGAAVDSLLPALSPDLTAADVPRPGFHGPSASGTGKLRCPLLPPGFQACIFCRSMI